GPVNGSEHAPQHVALEGSARHGRRLLIRRPALLRHHLQGVPGVAWRLGEASPEGGEPGRIDPGVVTLERGEALRHQTRRGQLRQRRCPGLNPRPGAGEVDVGIDGEPYPGDNVLLVPY